jgi:hypothetical protein
VAVVRDGTGEVISELPAANTPGFQRVVWNLRAPVSPPEDGQQSRRRQGPLVEPGIYSVTLEARSEGEVRTLSEPETLEVLPLGGTMD